MSKDKLVEALRRAELCMSQGDHYGARQAIGEALAAAPAAPAPAPLSRQQIDKIMTKHYPLDSLLRENVDAFEACVRDIEAAIAASSKGGAA